MSPDLVYLVGGAALLLGVVLPTALSRVALSAPIVLVVVGAGIGLLPGSSRRSRRSGHRALTEHLTEFSVLVALMGVGLALDRPLQLRSLGDLAGAGRRPGGCCSSACRWPSPRRALLGWWVMGLAPAAALLVAAVLAPTDPVLAADVQVEGPSTDMEDAARRRRDRREGRGALRAHLGGGTQRRPGVPVRLRRDLPRHARRRSPSWGLRWVGWELVGKTVIGVAVGAATGWLLAKIAFRAPRRSLRLAETGEPLLALAATLLAYGLAEVAGGWGFLAVFACALTLRSAERSSEYHALMHQVVERLERLLTLIVLLLLGVALTDGLLSNLTWQGAVLGVAA